MDRYCWTKYGMLKIDEISDSYYRHGIVDKEIERKNEALKKYGLHKEGCDIECYYEEPIDSDKCTCGLSQALKEKK